MAGILTTYAANKINEWFWREASLGQPSTWQLGLFTTVPTAADHSSPTGEADYTGYARVSVTASTFWASAASGATSNASAATFPTIPSGESETIQAVGIYDGTYWWGFVELTNPQTFTAGTAPKFAAGKLAFTLGSDYTYYGANKILDNVLKNTSYSVPAAFTIKLLTTLFDRSEAGGTALTSGSNGYTEQSFNTSNTNWGASSSGATSNLVAVAFGTNTTTDWGTIVGLGYHDGSSNYVKIVEFSAEKEVTVGDDFSMPIGSLKHTMS